MNTLRGVIPPLTTPFDAEENLDEKALRSEVRYMIEQARVAGIVVGGSTGEGHTLSTDELRRLAAVATEEAAGRIPVLVGVIVDSTRQAIERARAVADLPVAALQITPVHYLFKPSDEMMMHHFRTVAEAVPIPLMIYNVVPWSYCSPDLLVRLLTEVPGVIGVKQSAGDLKLLADLLLKLEGRGIVMTAVDALLYPSFVLGADGAIAALLSAAPELVVRLWEAVQQNDHALALDCHKKLLRLWNALLGDNLPANVKTALELQGRRGGCPRSPMASSSPAQVAAIRAALVAAGIVHDG